MRLIFQHNSLCLCRGGILTSLYTSRPTVCSICCSFTEIRKIIITRCFTCCETKLPSSHPVKCGLRGIKWVVREAWQRRRLSSGLLFTLSLHLSLSLTHTQTNRKSCGAAKTAWSKQDYIQVIFYCHRVKSKIKNQIMTSEVPRLAIEPVVRVTGVRV